MIHSPSDEGPGDMAPELLAHSQSAREGSIRLGGSPVVKFPAAFVSRIVPFVAFLVLSAPAGAGEIRGRILVADRADKPALGVTISAVPWETPGDEARREMKGGEPPKPIASATTGADGSFVLTVPPAEPGREKLSEKLFRVRAEGAGIVPVLFEGVYDAAETEDLGEHTLPHGERLSGIAVDAAGKPLAGAAVSLEPDVAGGDDLAYRVVARAAVTGEDGKFQFAEASVTGNRITIEKTGLAPARETGLRAGALPRPITVVSGDPVTGVVLGAGKKPAAGALVRLESAKATTRWVETDAEGRFTIPHAPDGRGAIVVDAGEAGWGSRPDVKLPLGEGKSLTITLALPASLDGKVVDDKTGRVVPRAKVFVKANGFARLARTGPDGLYHLKGIPPQTYRLTVDEARYVSWLKPDLALNPGEVRRLDVAITLGATMIGKVVDENGAPVPAARGTLARGGENAIAGIRRMLRVGGETTAFRTRADAQHSATRLAPGDNQRLFVSHADFERATLAGLSLPSGGTKSDVAIVMRRGATISGVVKDVNDQPIADVEVQVDPSVNFRAGAGGMIATFARIGGPSARPKTKTAADGTFHITGMSVGEYALQVRKPGFANERVDPVKVTDKGAESVAVTLGPGAERHGHTLRALVGHLDGVDPPVREPGLPDLERVLAHGHARDVEGAVGRCLRLRPRTRATDTREGRDHAPGARAEVHGRVDLHLDVRDRLIVHVLHDARDRGAAAHHDRHAALRPARRQRESGQGRALEVGVVHGKALVVARSEARRLERAVRARPKRRRLAADTQHPADARDRVLAPAGERAPGREDRSAVLADDLADHAWSH